MYDIYINGISCSSLKIYPVKRPDIPAPVKKINEHEILGRDGKLYQDSGFYNDIEIQIEFNYMSPQNLWHETYRKCKKLFFNAKKIALSDDPEYFYKIKKTVIGTNERNSKRIGRFGVIFTLDPYAYLLSGLDPIKDYSDIYNLYDTSLPVYKIRGEGMCHLIVNKTDVTCNIGQNLTIDTALELSYREDGTLQNTSINKDYKDLRLLEGKNSISISRGFELEIIPNWRCI